jgi:hypothetical protein
MEVERRWSAASPAAFQYLFPHIRVKKVYSLTGKRHVNDAERTTEDAAAKRPRIPIRADEHSEANVDIAEEPKQRIPPSNPDTCDGDRGNGRNETIIL